MGAQVAHSSTHLESAGGSGRASTSSAGVWGLQQTGGSCQPHASARAHAVQCFVHRKASGRRAMVLRQAPAHAPNIKSSFKSLGLPTQHTGCNALLRGPTCMQQALGSWQPRYTVPMLPWKSTHAPGLEGLSPVSPRHIAREDEVVEQLCAQKCGEVVGQRGFGSKAVHQGKGGRCTEAWVLLLTASASKSKQCVAGRSQFPLCPAQEHALGPSAALGTVAQPGPCTDEPAPAA